MLLHFPELDYTYPLSTLPTRATSGNQLGSKLIDKLPDYAEKAIEIASAWQNKEAFFTMYTSGSTAKPKPILLQRDQLIASADMSLQALDIPKRLPFLLALHTHSIGGFMLLIRALHSQHPVHVVPPSRHAATLYRQGRRYGLASFVPMQLHALREAHALDRLAAFDTVLIGGATLEPALCEAIIQALRATNAPTRVYHTYGSTETLSHVALRPIFPTYAACFEALPSVQFRVEDGLLKVTSPALKKWVNTQDLVRRESKRTFTWLGRADAVINSGGVMIGLDGIDQHLRTLYAKLQWGDWKGFAWGVPDNILGSKLVLFLPKPLSESAQQQLIQAIAAYPFDPYHRPQNLCFATWQYTPSGKVDKIQTAAQPHQTIPIKPSP